MVIIEGILRQHDGESDFYAPQYFQTDSDVKDLLRQGGALLYGHHTVNYSPTAVAIKGDKLLSNLDKFKFEVLEGNVITILFYKANSYTQVLDTSGTPDPDTQYFTRVSLNEFEPAGTTNGYLTAFVPGQVYHVVDKELTLEDEWIDNNPPIPPEYGWAEAPVYEGDKPTKAVNTWVIRMRYLSAYDETAPRYYSFEQDPISFGLEAASNNKDLLVVQKIDRFNPFNTLFFVNGLCCKPKVEQHNLYGDAVRLSDGLLYLRNQSDRKRGVIAVDFSKQCNMNVYPAKDLIGEFPTEFNLPQGTTYRTHSFLVVIDGRLYLPGDFRVMTNNTILLNKKLHKDLYTLDRQVCEMSFYGTTTAKLLKKEAGKYVEAGGSVPLLATRNLKTEGISMTNANNSFLITLDRPNLIVEKHNPHGDTDESQFTDLVTHQPSHAILFNGTARGLLFDTSSRSVVEYTAEYNDATFYASNSPTPRRWNTVLARVHHCTPLEIWGNHDNDMSATLASMHDSKTVRNDVVVVRPRFVMLDFLFKS